MTSDFDTLMTIYGITENNSTFKSIANWLVEVCISEADKIKPDWNFESWKKSSWGKTVLAVHGEEALKWKYLNDCHELDHTKWHLKVFKSDTQMLIRNVYRLLKGHDISKSDEA